MKKGFRLLLFFLFLFISGGFCAWNVSCKEIKYEMRGAHLSLHNFDFLNFDFNVDEFKNYVIKNYDLAKEKGINTLFLDLSQIVDCCITEKFNEKQENLISFLVREGFKRCLDIHACFSDFSLKNLNEGNIESYIASLKDSSFIKNNIEWIVKFNDKYYLDLGVHEVRDYLIDFIVNFSTKFKFDGVLLNSVVYPENINKYSFNDSYSYANYNEDKLSKEVWRRQNVNDFVKILGEKFKSYKNELKFGIGASYVWRNSEDDLNGIEYEGYSDYDRGSFDSLNIGKMNYVNYIVVKISDDINLNSDIENIISWWEKKFRTYAVDLFIEGGENIKEILEEVRGNLFVNGFVSRNFENLNFIEDFLNQKSIPPRYKSFDSYYTVSSMDVNSKISGENLEFNILNEGFENTKGFILYKFPYDDLDFTNGEYINLISSSGGKSTKLSFKKHNGVYALTKFNYNSIESKSTSIFIFGESIGLVEGKILPEKPKVVNSEIEFKLNSINKDNEFKILIEKDGEIILENEFSNNESFKFLPEKSGIYKAKIFIKNGENSVVSHLNFEVKDKYDVVLDAGHGGEETGAKTLEGILEKDINLSICRHTTDLFKNVDDINVKNIRLNDIKIDLSDRVKLCSFLGGDMFLSIHQNAFDNEKVNGVETYYYLKENFSKKLSEIIQKNLVSETNAFDRGIKNSNFVVLRESIVPSILIECGFITNVNELNNLIEENYQKSISKGIFQAINSFLDLQEI